MTERSDRPERPERPDDPYGHLFRDEPAQPDGERLPGADYFQRPAMLSDPDDFFEDDEPDDAPAHDAPAYGAPVGAAPGHDVRSDALADDMRAGGTHNGDAAAPAETGRAQQSHNTPSRNEPSHDAPSHDAPSHDEPAAWTGAEQESLDEARQAPAAPPAAPTPAAPASRPSAGEAETGRLFRSINTDPATGAIPALRSDERRQLRTIDRHRGSHATGSHATESHGIDRRAHGIDGDEPDAIGTPPGHARDAAHARAHAHAQERETGSRVGRRSHRKAAHAGLPSAVPSGPGLRAIGVFVVVIAVTLLLGLVDALIGPGLGPIFGVGLLLSSAYGAFAVRRDDALYAVTAPPIAALLAVVTVGQLNTGTSTDSFTSRIIVAFFSLADNWIWIIGATLLALVIVIVRGVIAKRA